MYHLLCFASYHMQTLLQIRIMFDDLDLRSQFRFIERPLLSDLPAGCEYSCPQPASDSFIVRLFQCYITKWKASHIDFRRG